MLTAGGWLGGISLSENDARQPDLARLLSVRAAAILFVPPPERPKCRDGGVIVERSWYAGEFTGELERKALLIRAF